MEIKDLQKPLPIESIDFRVQSVNKGGYATILAYKDARVDMNRLDEVVGALSWKREHFDNNRTCRVSIFNEPISQWISKEDVGTVSNTEAAKGLASDSFKRACFNWGIGRELYDYPLISIKLDKNEFEIVSGKAKPTWDFKLKEWVWISEFKDNKLVALAAKDQNGKVRFNYGTFTKKTNQDAK
jgi:hypothetical protein